MSWSDACKNLINRFVLAPVEARLAARMPGLTAPLEARVKQLEERVYNYHRHRWDAIEAIGDYLVVAQVPGDYLEFGVFQGTTFAHAARVLGPALPDMRFFALDSFQGLPRPEGLDNQEGYSAGFYQGQFNCGEDEFLAGLKAKGVDLSKVKTVPGWFNESLPGEKGRALGISKVAFAWIDCDLYESTVPVLEFLTGKLSIGTVLYFDDWRSFRNLPDRGEELALSQWLDANPQIKLRKLHNISWHGIAFTVQEC